MFSTEDDFYTILGVDRKDEIEDIRSAYRRLAREYHPDFNPSPEAAVRFKNVAEAYRILSDERLRKQYDTLSALTWGIPFDKIKEKIGDPERISALLKKVGTGLAAAAGLFRKKDPEPGRDMRITESISFLDSFFGTKLTVEYQRKVFCPECKSTGFSQVEPCTTCSSSGRLEAKSFPGIRKKCPKCNGNGWIGIEICENCRGKKQVSIPHQVTIKIPPGASQNQRLRVKGEGEGGRGFGGSGTPGDLMVVLDVLPHPNFKREGSDLHANLDLPLSTLALGGTVEVELPSGSFKIKIPYQSRNGKNLRIAGAGFPDPKAGKSGDCFLALRALPPSTDEENEVFELYDRFLTGHADIMEEDLKNKIKKAFVK